MKKKDTLWFFIFIGPSIIGFSIFYLVPFVLSIYYSFVDNMFAFHFVWFDNYKALYTNQAFILAFKNTLLFLGAFVPLSVIIALYMSMKLHQGVYFKSYIFLCVVVPMVIPTSAVAIFWQMLFDYNGWMNAVFVDMGGNAVDWLNSPYARFILLVLSIWKYNGYSVIVLTLGLSNIPKPYYEVAQLEGASRRVIFRKITLIYMIPSLFFAVILSVLNAFKVFRESILLTGRYPYDDLYLLQYFFNNNFAKLDYQKLSSAAVTIFFFIYIVVFILFKAEKKLSRHIHN